MALFATTMSGTHALSSQRSRLQCARASITSGFHYLLECHDLGGKNADGGYGGPLCQDPFGEEVQGLVKQILADSEKDRTLCYNNFMDPCPELTDGEKISTGSKLVCKPLFWLESETYRSRYTICGGDWSYSKFRCNYNGGKCEYRFKFGDMLLDHSCRCMR